jgi:hypothetical protein
VILDYATTRGTKNGHRPVRTQLQDGAAVARPLEGGGGGGIDSPLPDAPYLTVEKCAGRCRLLSELVTAAAGNTMITKS